jgi:hypothetical protein
MQPAARTRGLANPRSAVIDRAGLGTVGRWAGTAGGHRLYRALGDVRHEAGALFWIGCFHHVVRHDNTAAVPVLEQSLELASQAGDKAVMSEALQHLEESTRLRRETGQRAGAAANMVGLAYIAAAQHHSDDALALLARSMPPAGTRVDRAPARAHPAATMRAAETAQARAHDTYQASYVAITPDGLICSNNPPAAKSFLSVTPPGLWSPHTGPHTYPIDGTPNASAFFNLQDKTSLPVIRFPDPLTVRGGDGTRLSAIDLATLQHTPVAYHGPEEGGLKPPGNGKAP